MNYLFDSNQTRLKVTLDGAEYPCLLRKLDRSAGNGTLTIVTIDAVIPTSAIAQSVPLVAPVPANVKVRLSTEEFNRRVEAGEKISQDECLHPVLNEEDDHSYTCVDCGKLNVTIRGFVVGGQP